MNTVRVDKELYGLYLTFPFSLSEKNTKPHFKRQRFYPAIHVYMGSSWPFDLGRSATDLTSCSCSLCELPPLTYTRWVWESCLKKSNTLYNFAKPIQATKSCTFRTVPPQSKASKSYVKSFCWEKFNWNFCYTCEKCVSAVKLMITFGGFHLQWVQTQAIKNNPSCMELSECMILISDLESGASIC